MSGNEYLDIQRYQLIWEEMSNEHTLSNKQTQNQDRYYSHKQIDSRATKRKIREWKETTII